MPAKPRKKQIDESRSGNYHCIARCVRRARLAGYDEINDCDYGYRRGWIIERMKFLAALFAIEIKHFAVEANQFQLILCNLPRLVAGFDDREVIRRACLAFPSVFKKRGIQSNPTDEQFKQLCQDAVLVAVMRKRLSSISWFMRQLCQNIARRANEEDGVTGHFWESRFKSIPLLDQPAVVLCGVYIDLAFTRSGEANSPSESKYCSAYFRQQGIDAREAGDAEAWRFDGWFSPIGRDGDGQSYPRQGEAGTYRAAATGGLPISIHQYRDLLSWTAARIDRPTSQSMPDAIAESLCVFHINPANWLELIVGFPQLFRFAVGSPQSLRSYAEQQGICRMRVHDIVTAAFEVRPVIWDADRST